MSDEPNDNAVKAAKNTDRELWREIEDDHYSVSVHVTQDGKIGMNVGGSVIVKTVREWHDTTSHLPVLSEANGPEPICCCAEAKKAMGIAMSLLIAKEEGFPDPPTIQSPREILENIITTPCPRPDKCRCGEIGDLVVQVLHYWEEFVEAIKVNDLDVHARTPDSFAVSQWLYDTGQSIRKLESAIRKE